jgi:hypothetical protein
MAFIKPHVGLIAGLRFSSLVVFQVCGVCCQNFLGERVLHGLTTHLGHYLAAFTEYATGRNWVASHLMQLTGMALMVAALVLLSQRIAGG